MKYVTRGNFSPNGKPRVYFTCHPEDFEKHFQKVCDDIFKSHSPAIFYTPDMTAKLDADNMEADLGRCNLFVIPVTYNLLTTPNRAMNHDFAYAKSHGIPVLPLMMESGLDELYSAPKKFGELQYLNPFSTNHTEISYTEKLRKFLDIVLISEELAQRVRSAFDAYIFLSYRKKDRAYANKLIKLIHNNPEYRDIAIWFDEFLSPGESFTENIEKILKNSELFALLVTPNLLEEPGGKPNFVMGTEYPAALASGMKIIPTEMEETDKNELSRKFKEIPPCVKPETELEKLKAQLAEALSMAAKTQNDDDPEHNFLIGLAYLEGIDVEVDKNRGIDLITRAANAQLPEAMIKLRDMHRERIDSDKKPGNARYWAGKIYHYYMKTLGEEHPDTMAALNIYADLCIENGEYKFAYKILNEAYDLYRNIYGEKHPETLNMLNVFAMSSEKVLEFDGFLELSKKACTLSCEALGEEHPVAMTAINNYATLYYNKKKYKKAVGYYEKAYRLRCNALGENNPDTLRTMDSLADAYTKIKKHKKAMVLREKEHSLYSEILGKTHPDTLTKLHDYGVSSSKAGKKTEAIEILKKAYSLRSAYFGEDDYSTLSSLSELGAAYNRILKWAQGARVLIRCQLNRKSFFNMPGVPPLFDNSALGYEELSELKRLLDLIDDYDSRGEKNSALEAFEKVYMLCCDILGEEHMFTHTVLNGLLLQYWEYHRYIKALKCYFVFFKNSLKIFGPLTKEIIKLIGQIRKEEAEKKAKARAKKKQQKNK